MDRFCVFVVEDDKMYQRMLSYLLQKEEDLDIHFFDNATSCLEHLHLQPDIISMDYTLPDIEGKAFLLKLKSSCTAEVIVLSSQNDPATVTELLKTGVYDFIVKDLVTKHKLKNTLQHLRELISLRRKLLSLSN